MIKKHLKIKVDGETSIYKILLKNWSVILLWIIGTIISLGITALIILSILCLISVVGNVEIGAIKPDLSWVRILGIAYLFKN